MISSRLWVKSTSTLDRMLKVSSATQSFGLRLLRKAADQLKTFAAMTGGRSWLPRFDGEIPSIMQDVAASLRNQYTMAYSPANNTLDGKYRKIKVELVAPDGGPLTVLDQKGKKVKFQVYERQGYTAPKSGVDN